MRYSRNPSRLWETRSTARAISLSAGEYIKFLHDDDVLHDGCIAALVEAFARAPQAALASVRRLVDEAGELTKQGARVLRDLGHFGCVDRTILHRAPVSMQIDPLHSML